MYPEPITELNATDISATEIHLKWDIPKGEYNSFEIQYLKTDTELTSNLTNDDSITITDLRPHRNYTFTVGVRSGTESSVLRSSLPVSATFTTKESYPGSVSVFKPTDVQPSQITFNWSMASSDKNGIIQLFSITYGLEGSAHTQLLDFKPNEMQGTITNLLPGRTYAFRIQAKTEVGYGLETTWREKMPILAPPKPATQVVPTEVYRSSSSIQIRFRKNYFSDANGQVNNAKRFSGEYFNINGNFQVNMYTIIVAEDDTKNASGLEMPSWRDVQSYSVWPPFQAIEPYYPFKNSSIEDFTIGVENCESRQSGYCNGPLKSGTTYRVKVRAFTALDKFTDTAYSFPIQTGKFKTLYRASCYQKRWRILPKHMMCGWQYCMHSI